MDHRRLVFFYCLLQFLKRKLNCSVYQRAETGLFEGICCHWISISSFRLIVRDRSTEAWRKKRKKKWDECMPLKNENENNKGKLWVQSLIFIPHRQKKTKSEYFQLNITYKSKTTNRFNQLRLSLCYTPERKCKAKVLICSAGPQGSGVPEKNFPEPCLLAAGTSDCKCWKYTWRSFFKVAGW